MKPLYIFLLLFAIFITGLSDGISFGLAMLPGIGIVLDLAIEFCINATMGAGMLLLLVMNGMYHPKWGPAGTIAGLIPGLNVLPFWLGLVIAGIQYDRNKKVEVTTEKPLVQKPAPLNVKSPTMSNDIKPNVQAA